MLFFLALLMNPFFMQDGMIMENTYIQEADDDAEEDKNDSAILLGYNPFGSQSGKIMNILYGDESSDNASDEAKEENLGENSEEDNEGDSEGDLQDIKHVTNEMDQEYGEMRMIQLTDCIAQDLGMIVKVSYNNW